MTKFEIGKVYAQEYGHGDGKYRRECIKRTECFVTFLEPDNRVRRYKINIDSKGHEIVYNAGWITSEAIAQTINYTITDFWKVA